MDDQHFQNLAFNKILFSLNFENPQKCFLIKSANIFLFLFCNVHIQRENVHNLNKKNGHKAP